MCFVVICRCVSPGGICYIIIIFFADTFFFFFFFFFFSTSLLQGVQDGWKAAFDIGVQAYLSGDWTASIASLNQAEKLYGKGGKRDGPTKSLLTQMELRGNIAPADWIIEGQTSGFRQLTSK